MPIMDVQSIVSVPTDENTGYRSYRTGYVETRVDDGGDFEDEPHLQTASVELRFGYASHRDVEGGVEIYVQTTDFNWIIPLRLGPDEALKLAQDMVDEIALWKANHPHG